MTLYQRPKNTRVRIVRITGGATIRKYLSQLGVRIGDIILIKRNAPFGGPILLERNGIEVAVGRRIAEAVIVEEVG